MRNDQQSFKKCKAACWALKEELGFPRWLKDVEVSADLKGEYFLVMFVPKMNEEIMRQEIVRRVERFVRFGFRGYKVEIKELSR